MLSQEPFCRIEAELGEIVEVGETPYGGRRVIEILSGAVTGKVQGRILPGGSDWQIVRTDGVLDIQARYVIETAAGTRILVRSDGLRHGPPEVLAQIARGEAVDPKRYYFRTVLRFETSDPELAWLNRMIALARAERRRTSITLDVYEVL